MLQHKDEFIDVVAENFVNAYINEFNPKIIEWYSYGTPKVPEIGKLLAESYKENKIGRYRHYCEIWQDGYPKWFYIYFLTENEF
jgi:hypothetical protein